MHFNAEIAVGIICTNMKHQMKILNAFFFFFTGMKLELYIPRSVFQIQNGIQNFGTYAFHNFNQSMVRYLFIIW